MSPPCGGDIALQSPYEDTAPVPEPKSYLATRTSDEQTTRMVGKLSSKTEIKDFLSHLSHKTQNQRFGSLLINADLAFDFALKGTLCEGAGSAVFFRRD